LNDDIDPDINFYNRLSFTKNKYYTEDLFIAEINTFGISSNAESLHLNIQSNFKNAVDSVAFRVL
jgi:hypothetical protein